VTFGIPHCFFVIAHDRRRIIHCNVTRHPSSAWISQQLREAFPYEGTPSYLIFDRAANFNEKVISTVKSFGIQPKRSSFRSPWQNGIAERWVGNCRRDLLNQSSDCHAQARGLASSLRFGRLSFDQATTTLRINSRDVCLPSSCGAVSLGSITPHDEKIF
jgi:transposase InsO family protein